jgi:hypothetical protein
MFTQPSPSLFAVIAGINRSKNGVASLADDPAIPAPLAHFMKNQSG